jgi:pyruvate kinase
VRSTKVVCTIGPASEGRLPELVDAGMDVARINLSHGTRDEHRRMLAAVRVAGEGTGRRMGVMADLSGPKVRLGELDGGQVRLEHGSRFVLRSDQQAGGDGTGASTTHPGLAQDLEPGDRVVLADGAVELRVLESGRGDVLTEVVRGGTVRSRAGVNAPSERLSLPAVTPKDHEDLEWALGSEVDMVAQSFVRRAGDVRSLAGLMGSPRPLLLAKVETRAAVDHAAGVLKAADGVIVARGDLGVETALEEIPLVQKRLVSMAAAAAKPVIVATQMLESMLLSPRPTRAEAGDVAGAVFEGADAVMLSGETAIGAYPVEAAATAARILEVTESKGAEFLPRGREPAATDLVELPLARAAAVLARQGGAVAVACFTQSGRTARLLSVARPGVPIFAFSPDAGAVGRMTLFHGVTPRHCQPLSNTDAMIATMDAGLRAWAAVGQTVVMVASSPAGRSHANLLKVHRLGS